MNFRNYLESIEDQISLEISKTLKKKDKKSVYFFDPKLTGEHEFDMTVRRALIGVIIKQAPDAKDEGKTIKVFKYNYKFLD